MMLPTPNRRWLRFSLRALFVVVALAGTMGYWAFRHYAYERALYDYEASYAGWEAVSVTGVELCDRSLRLYRAEAAVPFANQRRAAAEHLQRIEHVLMRDYGPTSEWRMGASDEAARAESHAQKALVEQYHVDAKQLADR